MTRPVDTKQGGAVRRLVRENVSWIGELLALRGSPIYAATGLPRGDDTAVLVIPGFLEADAAVRTLCTWLRRTGRRPSTPEVKLNADCGEATVRRLERQLEHMATESGGRVAIIGHSRGGHTARVLAVRRPDLVSGIVTLATPTLGRRGAIHPAPLLLLWVMTALGTLGVPGLLKRSCFTGACCSAYRGDLEGLFPPNVGFVELLSKQDGFVDCNAVAHAGGERRWVAASHVGFVVNAEAYAAISDALASFKAPAKDRAVVSIAR